MWMTAFRRRPKGEGWGDIGAWGTGWLVCEFEFTEDWDTWEMHPQGDEFVYLLSGAAQLLIEHADGVRSVELDGCGAVVVPRGLWHTARVSVPCRMLHITRGANTQLRRRAER